MPRARYFDGVTSRVHAVEIGVEAGDLAIRGDGVERRVPVRSIEVSEPGAGGLRILTFAEGGLLELELENAPEAAALLAQLGHHDSAVVRSHQSWGIAAACLLLLAAAIAGIYLALPWLSERIARLLPPALLARVGEETLALLDYTSFEPSELPEARRTAISQRFVALVARDTLPDHRMHFRHSKRFGANAFALPSGDIVVTDALVELAEDDDEVIGVLAHELGHLEERHALRGAIQGSAVGLTLAFYLGDVSSLGAGLSAFLLEAKYSRDFEREADAFAEAFLRKHAIPPSRLTALLERLDADSERNPLGAASGYLSTHPMTEERIRELETP